MSPQELQNSKEIDLSNVEFVFSDWDGTLVDSMPAYIESFIKTIRSRYEVDPKKLEQYYVESTGAPLAQQIKTIVKKYAGQDIEGTELLESEFFNNLKGLRPAILPGAKEFLMELKKKGKKIIVWSGTRTDILREKIELLSFSEYVDFAIGNEPGSDTKVKGSGLLEDITKHFQIEPQELAQRALVIGDGKGDIEAGKAIDAITGGFGKSDDPRLQEADFIFNKYEELLEKLV